MKEFWMHEGRNEGRKVGMKEKGKKGWRNEWMMNDEQMNTDEYDTN